MIEKLKKISRELEVIPTSNENYYQIVTPYYDLDGDLFEVYYQIGDEGIILTDAGTTLMRLSYSFDYETEKRMELIKQIIYSHESEIKGDIIWKKLKTSNFKTELHNFVQILVKISNMNIYSRSIIKDMFYENLDNYVREKLIKYNPQKDFYPLGEENPYKADYLFNSREKPILMFGVNNSDKAKLTTITCLQLITQNYTFQSLVIFKDFESITRNDRKRLLNASDKVFTVFDNDKTEIEHYFNRLYQNN